MSTSGPNPCPLSKHLSWASISITPPSIAKVCIPLLFASFTSKSRDPCPSNQFCHRTAVTLCGEAPLAFKATQTSDIRRHSCFSGFLWQTTTSWLMIPSLCEMNTKQSTSSPQCRSSLLFTRSSFSQATLSHLCSATILTRKQTKTVLSEVSTMHRICSII